MAMEDQALFFSSTERTIIVSLTWIWNGINLYQIAKRYVWPLILARRRTRAARTLIEARERLVRDMRREQARVARTGQDRIEEARLEMMARDEDVFPF
jgi:hypothetical protein